MSNEKRKQTNRIITVLSLAERQQLQPLWQRVQQALASINALNIYSKVNFLMAMRALDSKIKQQIITSQSVLNKQSVIGENEFARVYTELGYFFKKIDIQHEGTGQALAHLCQGVMHNPELIQEDCAPYLLNNIAIFIHEAAQFPGNKNFAHYCDLYEDIDNTSVYCYVFQKYKEGLQAKLAEISVYANFTKEQNHYLDKLELQLNNIDIFTVIKQGKFTALTAWLTDCDKALAKFSWQSDPSVAAPGLPDIVNAGEIFPKKLDFYNIYKEILLNKINAIIVNCNKLDKKQQRDLKQLKQQLETICIASIIKEHQRFAEFQQWMQQCSQAVKQLAKYKQQLFYDWHNLLQQGTAFAGKNRLSFYQSHKVALWTVGIVLGVTLVAATLAGGTLFLSTTKIAAIIGIAVAAAMVAAIKPLLIVAAVAAIGAFTLNTLAVMVYGVGNTINLIGHGIKFLLKKNKREVHLKTSSPTDKVTLIEMKDMNIISINDSKDAAFSLNPLQRKERQEISISDNKCEDYAYFKMII